MCGIVGIINLDNAEPQLEVLKRMNNIIAHRGPDDEGYYLKDRVALAHRRLSILDLSANGHQPMISDNQNFIIVFNGEVYNHLELRQQYLSNYTFKSHSDTETILYGFQEMGTKIFGLLNGIFALAINDLAQNQVIVVRDQFGTKPLYWYHHQNLLLFSSEIKALLQHPSFDAQLNPEVFATYLNFLWSPGIATPFQHVQKLLPGHLITIDIDTSLVKIDKYYDIPFTSNYSKASELELVDQLEQKLLKAVERQLLSDVPIGFYLSGGVDSSLIVAMAKKLRPDQKFRCFTIKSSEDQTFEGFGNDLFYARKVAEHVDVSLCEIDVQADIVQDFDKMIWYLDEPQADAAPLNVYLICKQAHKEGFKVLLGGTAGDDVFSGYRRHQALILEKYYRFLPKYLKMGLAWFANCLPTTQPTLRRAKKLLSEAGKTPQERMVGYFSWLPWQVNHSLFSKDIQQKMDKDQFRPDAFMFNLLHNLPTGIDPLNQCLYLELRSFLPDHNLNYTDKMSMATGVESRVPFLDLDLVNFSTSIPPALKLKGKTTKYLLKKVAEKYLPHEVIYRPKAGFGAPVREWITNDLQLKIDTDLNKESLQQYGIFDYNKIIKLINENKQGKIDASYSIWCLLAIQSWLKQFVKNK